MKNEPIKVSKSVFEVMNMGRAARRKIARQNGLKNIPSIVNFKVVDAPQAEAPQQNNEQPKV